MFVLLQAIVNSCIAWKQIYLSLGAVVSKGQADMLEIISHDKLRDCEWGEELFLNLKVTGWASLTDHVREG